MGCQRQLSSTVLVGPCAEIRWWALELVFHLENKMGANY